MKIRSYKVVVRIFVNNQLVNEILEDFSYTKCHD